jgi:hypothetical protein
MLDRIAEWILAIPNSVPVLLGADPENAALVRTLAALLLVAFIVYAIRLRPFRSIVAYLGRNLRKQGKTKG